MALGGWSAPPRQGSGRGLRAAWADPAAILLLLAVALAVWARVLGTEGTTGVLAAPPRPAARWHWPPGGPPPDAPAAAVAAGDDVVVVRAGRAAEVAWLDAAGALRAGPLRVPGLPAPAVGGGWATWVEPDGGSWRWLASDGADTRELGRLPPGAVPAALAATGRGAALAWHDAELRPRLDWQPWAAGTAWRVDLPRGAVLQLAAADPYLVALAVKLDAAPRAVVRAWTEEGREAGAWPAGDPPGRLVYAGPRGRLAWVLPGEAGSRLVTLDLGGATAAVPRVLAPLPGTVRAAWPLDAAGRAWAVQVEPGGEGAAAVAVVHGGGLLPRRGVAVHTLPDGARMLPVAGGWLVHAGTRLTAYQADGGVAWALDLEPGAVAAAAWEEGLLLVAEGRLEVWRAR